MGFQKARTMTFPRRVLAGHGVLQQIGAFCKGLELGTTALIVTGKATRRIAGDAVKDILETEKYNVHLVVMEETTENGVESLVALTKECSADFLLGVGGGSKIDMAKIAATKAGKPFISVPTSASHDGIASPQASLKGKNPISMAVTVPLGIVADTSVIVKAPYRLLASGCSDVISNLTAVKDWTLAHRLRNEPYSSSASVLSSMSARELIKNVHMIKPCLEESVWVVIRPLIEAGASMCIAGTSRPASGSEHMFSHALDLIAPGKGLHGEQCGLGAIMMMYLHDGDWMHIRDALRQIGAPTTASELELSKETIIEALVMANKIRPERYTVLGDNGLSSEAAERLASVTGVI